LRDRNWQLSVVSLIPFPLFHTGTCVGDDREIVHLIQFFFCFPSTHERQMTVTGTERTFTVSPNVVGRGANSTIYEVTALDRSALATDPDMARVAKVMSAPDADAAGALLNKCRAIQALPPHPAVVVYDDVRGGFQSDLDVTVLMQRYHGDLAEFLARHRTRGRVPIPTVLHIARQLSQGLSHLHRLGVWHLDLSLSNVLVRGVTSATPTVAIADLENSRVLSAEGPPQEFTAEFAAPERDAPNRCSDKCDVFSLAVLLHALASGSEFPGAVDGVPGLGSGFLSRAEMTPARIGAVMHRDLPESPHLAALLGLALSHDPSTRISMQSFSEAVEVLAGNGTLRFPMILAPVLLTALDDTQRLKVVVNDASGAVDILSGCCNCGHARHAGHAFRTDCIDGSMHLPGLLSPPSSFAPSVLASVLSYEFGDGALFRFAYPMASPTCAPSSPSNSAAGFVAVANESDPLAALQIHGGFLINTHHDRGFHSPDIAFAAGVHGTPDQCVLTLPFSAPQAWPWECTVQLQRQGRIRSPVPAFLRTCDSKAFSWILPGETFVLGNEEAWEPAPNGGFAFFFHDDATEPNELDRYFAVVDRIAPSALTIPAASPVVSSPIVNTVASLMQDAFRSVAAVGLAGASAIFRPGGAAQPAHTTPKPDQQALTVASPAVADRATTAGPAAATLPSPTAGQSSSAAPAAAVSLPRPDVMLIRLLSIVVPAATLQVEGSLWTCSLTGESGELLQSHRVGGPLAAALRLPPTTRTIRMLHCTVSPSDTERFFPHQAIAAFNGEGALVACRAFRFSTKPHEQDESSTSGERIALMIPAEGPTTPRYQGDDAPMRLQSAQGELGIAMVGTNVSPDGTKLTLFCASANGETWHVRKVRT
jgi:serine/threonine protein kinase